MKKYLAVCVMFFLGLAMLAACSSGNPPEGVDADAAETTAKEVIGTMNAKDYEALTALFREDLQPLVPADAWAEQIDPTLDTFGAFESYGEVSYVDKGNTDYGHLFSTVVVCNYENNTVTIEVVMDTDMAVTGLSFLQVR